MDRSTTVVRPVREEKRRVRRERVSRRRSRCAKWQKAHFQLERYKTHHSRSTFGSWHVQELHAAVAQSAFWSQHVQNTSAPERFWKLRSDKKVHALVAPSTCRSQNAKNHFWNFRCGESIPGFGAKHIHKSKVLNLTIPDHFLKLGCGFAGAMDLHLAKSEQNVRVPWHLQKRWQARDVCLAELLRFQWCQLQIWRKSARISWFWRCQLSFLRKSRRIATFWPCQLPLLKELLHNCFR